MKNTDNIETTQDFMKVEYFSQLPFTRPPLPPKENSIRLFGHEFSGAITTTTTASSSLLPPPQTNYKTGKETSRKFDCHYCCRNFPTSQALGGHQNAHKRERQIAKRAHLYSAAMAHAGISDFYGLPNYHQFSSDLPPAYNYSYNNNITSTRMSTSRSRFFSSPGSFYNSEHLGYNGNSLPATWRIPSRDRNLECYKRDASTHQSQTPVTQTRVAFEPKLSVPDNVCLDLHL